MARPGVRFTVDAEGVVRDILGLYERAVEAAREEVATALQRVHDGTELIVPVDTKFMRDHISILPSEDGLSGEVGWRDSVFLDAGREFYPPFVEFGTSKMAAQPALMPTFEEERPRFVEALRARLRAVVNEGRP